MSFYATKNLGLAICQYRPCLTFVNELNLYAEHIMISLSLLNSDMPRNLHFIQNLYF